MKHRLISTAFAAATLMFVAVFGLASPAVAQPDLLVSVSSTPVTMDARSVTVFSGSVYTSDQDGMMLVEFNFDAESTDLASSYAIGYDTFRLQVDGRKESPDEATTDVVDGNSHLPGYVSFVIPLTTRSATLLVYLGSDSPPQSLPVTFSGAGTDPADDPVDDPVNDSTAPPTVETVEILGGVSVEITDQSGVASNCTYSAPIVYRSFHLPANGTAAVTIVPLARLGIPYEVSIVCDNGTRLDTTLTW